MADARRRRRHMDIIYGVQRPIRDYANPLEVLGDDELVRRHFRLYPAAILFVCGLVEPLVRRHYAYGLPVLIQVCATLKYLGSGSFLFNVGSNMTLDISTTSAWRSVHAVAIDKFPRGRRVDVVKDGFRRKGTIGQKRGDWAFNMLLLTWTKALN